jgi:hypothetical protein
MPITAASPIKYRQRTPALDIGTLPGYRPRYERNSHLPLQIHRLYLRRLRLYPSGRLHLRSPRLHVQRLITFSQGLDTPVEALALFMDTLRR